MKAEDEEVFGSYSAKENYLSEIDGDAHCRMLKAVRLVSNKAESAVMVGARMSLSMLKVYVRSSLSAIACLSASMLLPCSGLADADTVVGYVAEMHGAWKLYPHGADSDEDVLDLTNAHEIPAGAAIRNKTPSSRDFIIIMGLDLKTLEQRRCGSLESCNYPILLPKETGKPGFTGGLASLLREVWFRLENEAYQPSLHRVRGSLMMMDGVVMLRDRMLDLADIMRYARAGRYVLTRTEDAGKQLLGTQRTEFAWEPDTTTTIPVGELSPGLFDINEESAVAIRPPGNDPPARILVCAPSTYFEALSSFRRVRDITDDWTGSVDHDTTRAFLRSLLTSLAKNKEVCNYSEAQ
jgi:hypothetical protein